MLVGFLFRHHINQQLSSHDSSDRDSSGHLAALIIEPLVQGAGGMMVVDPLFQKQLVQVSRGVPCFGHVPNWLCQAIETLFAWFSPCTHNLL